MHRSMFTISIILSKLPSPRGVRIASMKFFAETCGYTLLSPRGVRVASPKRARRGSRSTRCRPREGAGCIVSMFDDFDIDYNQLPSPRGVRVASFVRGQTMEVLASCRPREGCGLHQQKDTNPYQHICRFHTTRRLSITQGQQKMQGVLCLLYRKRECNLIVGSANRLFLRDKNAREKQRLAGNC